MIETFVMVKHPSGHSNRSVKVEIYSKQEIQEICREVCRQEIKPRMIPLKDPPPKPPKVAPPVSDNEGKIQKTNVTSTSRPKDRPHGGFGHSQAERDANATRK